MSEYSGTLPVQGSILHIAYHVTGINHDCHCCNTVSCVFPTTGKTNWTFYRIYSSLNIVAWALGMGGLTTWIAFGVYGSNPPNSGMSIPKPCTNLFCNTTDISQ